VLTGDVVPNYMKSILLILILIVTQTSMAQKSEIEQLMLEGNQAFNNSDFDTAREKYSLIIKIDSLNKDATFNLGATFLNLGQNDKACEQFQKAYSNGDIGAFDVIIQYCGVIKNVDKMIPNHVDELPKFKYNGKFIGLILRKNKYQKEINPLFIDFLKTEFKKSKDLKKLKDKFYISFKNVTKEGELVAEIKGDIKNKYKEKILEILKNNTEYYPAIYNGEKVELTGGGFTLPVSVQ
jgi:tetratricopeptide (TPR) repeat protein